MSTAIKLENHERRRHTRHPFNRYVFYATESRFYQGNLKDYSRGGLCIEAREILKVGKIITIALPYVEEKNHKRKAQVVWASRNGFGVEFFPLPEEAIDVLRF